MSIILRNHIIKTQRGQRIGQPELDPNPNLSRTHAGLSRDVANNMNSSDLGAWVILYGPVRAHGVSLSSPRNPENLETRDFAPRRGARDSAEVPPFATGMGSGCQRPKRLEKPRIWSPEDASRAGSAFGAGGRRGAGGGGAAEFQKFRFSESGRSDFFVGGLLPTHKRHSVKSTAGARSLLIRAAAVRKPFPRGFCCI